MEIEKDPRLLVLDPKHGKILSFNTEGGDLKILLEGCTTSPDGIVVDSANRHIYWTNMGYNTPNSEFFEKNDGSVERMDFDGSNRKIIVPAGEIFTPKQLAIDLINHKLYWCDREGMRVMRSSLDGSDVTTLVKRGEGDTDRLDELKRCVGITLDVKRGHMYWTQKGPHNGGLGRIFRAGINLPQGADPATRKDIEVLWDNLPEPIDLEIDHADGYLYWTDRGLAPKGNTLNRAYVLNKYLQEPQILCNGLKGVIGLTLDITNRRVFFVDVAGNLYSCEMDGQNFKLLYSGDHILTGIVYVPGGLD
jgi:hypothetical protein